jgi:hypothetical protein
MPPQRERALPDRSRDLAKGLPTRRLPDVEKTVPPDTILEEK